ncbi:MAG TPA: sigma-70 family RNA polymerase sigma factor, partial [Pyrinomonadaceae bacterium]|nr:sigma-70 family RNA polymerase sigma factor [Pyrinomonadaceae bacterium]
TNRNRTQAEDLVHDAFIQFTLRRSELGAIENTDAYLNRMLRNMYLSQIRRATLIQDSPFSIASFDSAEIGLRTIDPRERVDVQDDLRQICQYACERKEGSKAGCVLILRFFHGYYPSEIAQILRTSRKAVDRYLLISRREAKLYLSDPSALKFTAGFTAEGPSANASQLGYLRTTSELLGELREAIFAARKGECIEAEQLKEFYRKTSGAVDVKALSHVVSCQHCLDTVNRILGLPLLAERNSDDRLSRDVPPESPGGGEGGGGDDGGGGSAVDSKRRYQRRLRETIEHRPQELRIAVNGFVLGAQEVSSEFNKQVLSINIDEPIGFIEVFSEQGVRLLFFDVDQPIDGTIEQTARAEFDCGRALDLSLNFRGPWPSLNVSYHDPTFEAVESYVEATEYEVQSPTSNVQSRGGSPTVKERLGFGLLAKMRAAFASLVNKSKDFGLGTWDVGLLLRPGTVTALVAVVLIVGALLIYRQIPTPPVSAADLLQKATASEEAIANNPDQVLHRTVRVEEKSATGQLIATRRVEIWHSAEKEITARRLYDENGSLIAGDWRRADGVQTIYHHGSRPRLQIRNPQSAIRNFEDVWQLDPTAKEFTLLIGGSQNAQAQATDNTYLISYSDANMAAPGLVKTSLVLARTDLHAIEQTLVVRQGNEVREYRFVETSFERRSPSSVAPAVFEPEPALINGDGVTGRRGEGETIPASPNLPVPPSPVLATPELELQVLKQLNSADAFYGEQISLTRTPEGRLRVQGIVETEKRKTEILQSLASLKRNPAVQIQVETAAEAADRQARQAATSTGPTQIGSVEGDARSPIPAAPELRAYFSRQGISGEALDDEVRRLADRVMGRTRQARRHALALNQIAQRFSADDLQALDVESRNQWRAMISQHARAAQQELEALRRELIPIFPSVSSEEADAGIEVAGDADFSRAGKRLFELTSAVDEAVGRSFSIYASGKASTPVKTSQFSRSLRSATRLAQRINKQ